MRLEVFLEEIYQDKIIRINNILCTCNKKRTLYQYNNKRKDEYAAVFTLISCSGHGDRIHR